MAVKKQNSEESQEVAVDSDGGGTTKSEGGGTLKRLKERALKKKNRSSTETPPTPPPDSNEENGTFDEFSGAEESTPENEENGAKGTDDDHRSKSSTDLREGDSPPVSRRKKMWNSFRKSAAKKMRSRSRGRKKSDEDRAHSHPDISPNGTDGQSPGLIGNHEDFDALFESAGMQEGSNTDTLQKERSFSDPTITQVEPTQESEPVETESKMGTLESKMSTLEKKKTSTLERKKKKKNRHSSDKDHESEVDSGIAIVDQSYLKKTMKNDEKSSKKLKTQIWNSVVTIVLVEGVELLPMDDNGFSDPYVKFRLGNEKYKSKYKLKTLNPRWLEQFDLHMYDDQTSHLEISVWDHDHAGKDDIMGRAVIDLSALAAETTHSLEQPLEDGAGIIKLLLTRSGTTGTETVSDLSSYTPNPKEREAVVRKYGLVNSVKAIKDVGYLQVKVIKAQGLASADPGGKSDPFCVLELVNDRLQTHTEYKTLYPEWGKVFTFNVKDVHSILEVTVYDEDRDKKVEFLGKIALPLLRIKQKERRWYQLKDKKAMGRVKGAILLELDLVFNHFKAAIRTFNPREEKYMQPEPKFKIAVLKRNIDRVSKIAEAGVEAGQFLQSCFNWESKARSITAFAVFLIITWNFELYMLPVTLLIVFLKNLIVVHIAGNLMKDKEEDDYVDEEEDEEEEEKDKPKKKKKGAQEEKKSFKEKLQQVQEVCLQVQEGMDMVASMGERVKNTFNWTVPWLSWLAIIILSIGTIVLYNVPVRYLILAWGINKFTKKLRAPNAIPNNELLDYLSRVPSDKELIMYRELRPDSNIGTMKRKRTQ